MAGLTGAAGAAGPRPARAWQAAGASVRGAQHERQGLSGQDAWTWEERDGSAFIAVADGHGSAPSARSDVGARLAVETARAVLLEPGAGIDWCGTPRGEAARPAHR
ncbi:MAG: protein phosphatase 2C domain-containing protein, partial [Terriglobales bacterium]